jgi:glycosyltransferase involved in cell wall biosynthesis
VEDVKESLGLKGSDRVIGVIGRLKKDRGYDVILKAFRKVRDQMGHAKLVIVGRSSQIEESIKKPLIELGLEQDVILAGYRIEDYFSVIASFDIFVMMRAGSDGTARALREVLGMGKPAIVSTQGMLPELVIDGQTGYAVDLGEHELADRMVRLLSDDKMRAQFGINARNYAVSEWDYSAQATRLIDFYKRLLERGRRR